MISRRGFLSFLGLGAGAVVAAPLIRPTKTYAFFGNILRVPKPKRLFVITNVTVAPTEVPRLLPGVISCTSLNEHPLVIEAEELHFKDVLSKLGLPFPREWMGREIDYSMNWVELPVLPSKVPIWSCQGQQMREHSIGGLKSRGTIHQPHFEIGEAVPFHPLRNPVDVN